MKILDDIIIFDILPVDMRSKFVVHKAITLVIIMLKFQVFAMKETKVTHS